MNALLPKLNRYYRSQGIHSLDFHCIHRASCSSGCENFTEAKASLVGSGYGGPVRVLVLSLDPGSGGTDPCERTPEAIAASHSGQDPDAMPKNRHWYRTHETVAALQSRLTDQKLVPRDIAGGFAHVNAAKCSHNLPRNKQAPKRLFENCRSFLEEELAILAPDIIITQGRKAAKVVEPWKKRPVRKHLLEIDGREVYWLELIHPTAWGGAYGLEKKSWPRRFGRARSWLDAR